MTLSHYDTVFSEKSETRRVNYFGTASGAVLVREKNSSTLTNLEWVRLKKCFREIFLPRFYPDSVSSDYLDYQIWDTVQAFCSTISGTLTTHAVFQGVGVGDTTATALSATITWIMKDGTGMIGRILFTWRKGYSLDSDCKKWRLAADLINDAAMCFELLLGSVYFKEFSPVILCCSTGMKAIVGVAGGATRASISQHQAIRNNMADVCAKDGSQETCVNLVASFLAVFILTNIEKSYLLIWIVFLLATTLHIFANYKAVKSLKLKTLNESRLLLLIHNYLIRNEVFKPESINPKESVFLGFGLSDLSLCRRRIYLGHSLQKIIRIPDVDVDYFNKLRKLYDEFPYCMAHDERSICISLRENVSDRDILMSYFHAVILGIGLYCHMKTDIRYSAEFTQQFANRKEVPIETLVNAYVTKTWPFFVDNMRSKGWNVNQHQLSIGEWRMKWDL